MSTLPFTQEMIDLFHHPYRSTSFFPPYGRVAVLSEGYWINIEGPVLQRVNMTNGFNRIGTAEVELSYKSVFKKEAGAPSDFVSLFESESAFTKKRTEIKIILGYGNVRFIVFQGWLTSYEISKEANEMTRIRLNCENRLSEVANSIYSRTGYDTYNKDSKELSQEILKTGKDAPKKDVNGHDTYKPDDIGKNPDQNVTITTPSSVVVTGGKTTNPPKVEEAGNLDHKTPEELGSTTYIEYQLGVERQPDYNVFEKLKDKYPDKKRVVSCFKISKVKEEAHLTFMVWNEGEYPKGAIVHYNLTKQKMFRIIPCSKVKKGQICYNVEADVYVYRNDMTFKKKDTYADPYKNDYWMIVSKDGSALERGKIEYEFEGSRLSTNGKFVYGVPANLSSVSEQERIYDYTCTGSTFHSSVTSNIPYSPEDRICFSFLSKVNFDPEKAHPQISNRFSWDGVTALGPTTISQYGKVQWQLQWEGNTFKLFKMKGGENASVVEDGSIAVDLESWRKIFYPEGGVGVFDSVFVGRKVHPYSFAGIGRNWFIWVGEYIIHLDFIDSKWAYYVAPKDFRSQTYLGLHNVFSKTGVILYATRKELLMCSYDTESKQFISYGMNYEGSMVQQSIAKDDLMFAEIHKMPNDPNEEWFSNTTTTSGSISKTVKDIRQRRKEELEAMNERGNPAVDLSKMESDKNGDSNQDNMNLYNVGHPTPLNEARDIINRQGQYIYVDNGSGKIFQNTIAPSRTASYTLTDADDITVLSLSSNDTAYNKVTIYIKGDMVVRMRTLRYPGEQGEEVTLHRPDLSKAQAQALANAYIISSYVNVMEIEIRGVPLLDVGHTVFLKLPTMNLQGYAVIQETDSEFGEDGYWMKLKLLVYKDHLYDPNRQTDYSDFIFSD